MRWCWVFLDWNLLDFSYRLAAVYAEVNGSQQDRYSEFKASMLTNKRQHNSGRPQSVNRAGLGSVSTKNTEEWVFSFERVEQRRADLWFPLWGAHVLLSQSHNKTNAHLYIFPENIRHGITDPIQLSQNMFEGHFSKCSANRKSKCVITVVLWVNRQSMPNWSVKKLTSDLWQPQGVQDKQKESFSTRSIQCHIIIRIISPWGRQWIHRELHRHKLVV